MNRIPVRHVLSARGDRKSLLESTAVPVDIKNIETRMEREIFYPDRSMERFSILMFPRSKRIYGSPKREVVDGLFRPMPMRACCLLRNPRGFPIGSIEYGRQTLPYVKAFWF